MYKMNDLCVIISVHTGKRICFIMKFPLLSQEDIARVTAKQDPVYTGVTHITFVDDDPEIRKSLKKYLTDKGITCKTYDHPARVLSLIQNQELHTDLILTDYAMPTMNGLEFAEIVRRLDPALPIFLVSSAADKSYDSYLRRKVIDRFIYKTDLIKELDELLQGR